MTVPQKEITPYPEKIQPHTPNPKKKPGTGEYRLGGRGTNYTVQGTRYKVLLTHQRTKKKKEKKLTKKQNKLGIPCIPFSNFIWLPIVIKKVQELKKYQ